MVVFRWMWLVLLSLLLAACSGKPSDAEAERLFAEQNKQLGFEELFDVENVKRVNGFEKEGQRYVVEMQFDLVARLSSDDIVVNLIQRAGGDFFAKARLNSDIETLKREYGVFQQGQRFTKKRQMVLQRTEAGWALAG